MGMKKKRLLTDKSGMLQEQMLASIVQEYANEVDTQVLFDMLEEIGWIRVVCKTPLLTKQRQEIDTWIKDNVKGHIENRGPTWMFEDSKDACAFILKWT
jgi:hypothetical protein